MIFMSQPNTIVIVVVCGRNLHHAGTKRFVHVVVGNHWNGASAQGQGNLLANQVGVTVVFRVDHQGYVAQHGFRPGGGHRQGARPIGQRVANVPQRAVFFFALHLQVGHRALQHRVPIDQALAAVDQALLEELHKGLGHCFGQFGVHGEVLAAPVHAVAHAAHLGGDGVAAFFFPLPDFGDKVFAAQVVAAELLILQLTLHHDLRGNASVVGAGHPDGVVATHAVVARQAVHDGLVESVPHVQRAGDIGWRQLNGKRLGPGLGRLRTTVACHAVATALPFRSPMGLQGGGLERFGQAVEARLLQFFVHVVFGWDRCRARDGRGANESGRL